MITVSAPGKVHLMGEHAVVYGKPALLAAINRRVVVSLEPSHDGLSVQTPEGESYIRHAVQVTCDHLGQDCLPDVRIVVSSGIPIGYHLGSSAAIAVATVGAVMYYLKTIWNPELINQLAYEVEKKQHGNPSGGDNTTVTFGGFIWFRKELEFLRSIWKFPFSFPQTLDHFVLINTGRPSETTGEMVAFVKMKREENPRAFEDILSDNEIQTKRVAQAIKEGSEELLIDAIQHGQRTLEQMGVVSERVIPLIRQIEEAGGAVKILGGGGRTGAVGFLLCYHRDPSRIQELCKPYGYEVESVTLGEEGIRLEQRS